jgi:HTH-type transcriptional regulator/antitoxin HigA
MMENIRPIKTEEDYEWTLAEITRYFDNQPEVGSPDGDRFDVLATLSRPMRISIIQFRLPIQFRPLWPTWKWPG